jgi:hypothetical protein
MQKIFWIILICLLFVLGTSACNGDDTPDVKEYTVIQIAGLYDQFSLSAKEIRALVPGTELIPAEGASEVTCKTLDEIILCNVQVVETGESGWVERQWLIESD